MAIQSVSEIRKRRKQFKGNLLIALCVILGLALASINWWVGRQQIKLNEDTLCPASGPKGFTVLLIDKTDPPTTVQREALRQRLDHLAKTLPIGAAIQVYSVGPTGDDLLTAESPIVCNPGKGEGASAWTGNPRLLEKRWRERFEEPIERVFGRMLQAGSSPRSPILESIQSVAIRPLGSLEPDVKDRRLVIVSDMLHNTEQFSQYQQLIPFSEFVRTEYYRKVRCNLAGVDVEIIYLRREQGLQGKDHIEFWQQYFADCGARLVHVLALEG